MNISWKKSDEQILEKLGHLMGRSIQLDEKTSEHGKSLKYVVIPLVDLMSTFLMSEN
jgi:hypothetical protein